MINVRLLGTGGGMSMPNRSLSATILSYRGSKKCCFTSSFFV